MNDSLREPLEAFARAKDGSRDPDCDARAHQPSALRRRRSINFEERAKQMRDQWSKVMGRGDWWFETHQRRLVWEFRRSFKTGTKIVGNPRAPLQNIFLAEMYRSSLPGLLWKTFAVFLVAALPFGLIFWASECGLDGIDTPYHLILYAFTQLVGLDMQAHIADELQCDFVVSLCVFAGLILQGITFVSDFVPQD